MRMQRLIGITGDSRSRTLSRSRATIINRIAWTEGLPVGTPACSSRAGAVGKFKDNA